MVLLEVYGGVEVSEWETWHAVAMCLLLVTFVRQWNALYTDTSETSCVYGGDGVRLHVCMVVMVWGQRMTS